MAQRELVLQPELHVVLVKSGSELHESVLERRHVLPGDERMYPAAIADHEAPHHRLRIIEVDGQIAQPSEPRSVRSLNWLTDLPAETQHTPF